MSMKYETIEQAARDLPLKQKASLAHRLLKDLDEGEDENVEAIWIEESKRRYEAYLRGDMDAIEGDEAMARLRKLIQ